jgi:hypothetical protein
MSFVYVFFLSSFDMKFISFYASSSSSSFASQGEILFPIIFSDIFLSFILSLDSQFFQDQNLVGVT